MKIREYLFSGMKGCTDGRCVVSGKTEGMHTNGGCKCMTDKLSRSDLNIIGERLKWIGDMELPERDKSEFEKEVDEVWPE